MVADGFTEVREFAFEPPAERAEPEERGIEPCKKLKVEIALANVGALVGENDTEFF